MIKLLEDDNKRKSKLLDRFHYFFRHIRSFMLKLKISIDEILEGLPFITEYKIK